MARARVPQTRIAAVLGLTQQAISRRLRGEVEFTVSELAAVAAELSVPISALIPDANAVRSAS